MATTKKQTRTAKPAADDIAVKLTPRDLAKEGAYLTVGLTDTAVSFVRTLPTKVEQWRSELPQVVKGLGEDRPKNLTEQLDSLRRRATGEVTSLAERGRTIVQTLQRHAKPADAVDQIRKAREQMRAATSDLRKAMHAGRGAVAEAADTARGTMRAASRASQRRQYESMTVEELQDLAERRDIAGRSELTKAELINALLKP